MALQTYASSGGLNPTLMTAADRIAEVGEILAIGLLRLRGAGGAHVGNPSHRGATFSWTAGHDGASVCGEPVPGEHP
jgi:hypothetical protein